MKPEAALQSAGVKWLRHALPQGSVVLSIAHERLIRDKQQAIIEWSQLKARGVLAGTPDTVCVVLDWPSVWIEWKVGGNKESLTQEAVINAIRGTGHHAFAAWSIADVETELRAIGMPLRATSMTAPEIEQKLAARAAARARPPRKPRADRSTAKMQQVARVERVRSRTPF